MTTKKERLEILDMVQRGVISPEEGARLIQAINHSNDETYQESPLTNTLSGETADRAVPDATGPTPEFKECRKWWIIPFWTGAGITVLGGGLMYWAWAAHGFGIGFFLAWIPFLIGIGLLVLGWNSQTGPWLHFRIQQKPGETPQHIAISIPLPIRFTAWGLRTFGRYIPELEGTNLDEIILALGDSSQDEHPLMIEINNDDEGEEKVKIYIG